MKLRHSADWQLGCRFAQFGEKAGFLRDARLKTLSRTLELAKQRKVDAFIIAGDLFDDSQVDEAVVTAALEVLPRSLRLRFSACLAIMTRLISTISILNPHERFCSKQWPA